MSIKDVGILFTSHSSQGICDLGGGFSYVKDFVQSTNESGHGMLLVLLDLTSGISPQFSLSFVF
jgi:hypothetical protein